MKITKMWTIFGATQIIDGRIPRTLEMTMYKTGFESDSAAEEYLQLENYLNDLKPGSYIVLPYFEVK